MDTDLLDVCAAVNDIEEQIAHWSAFAIRGHPRVVAFDVGRRRFD